MPHRVVFRDRALAEIEEAAEWYDGQRPRLGSEFVAAVAASVELIKSNPFQYQRVFKDRRRAVVARFHFNLIYFVSGDEVVIVACLHGRRSPAHWINRE
jgi:plasmid stabilization system protein ParE